MARYKPYDLKQAKMFTQAQLTADSGFHSAKSVEQGQQSGVDAYIADANYRRRDAALYRSGHFLQAR